MLCFFSDGDSTSFLARTSIPRDVTGGQLGGYGAKPGSHVVADGCNLNVGIGIRESWHHNETLWRLSVGP
jgi:hypothetical protein